MKVLMAYRRDYDYTLGYYIFHLLMWRKEITFITK